MPNLDDLNVSNENEDSAYEGDESYMHKVVDELSEVNDQEGFDDDSLEAETIPRDEPIHELAKKPYVEPESASEAES